MRRREFLFTLLTTATVATLHLPRIRVARAQDNPSQTLAALIADVAATQPDYRLFAQILQHPSYVSWTEMFAQPSLHWTLLIPPDTAFLNAAQAAGLSFERWLDEPAAPQTIMAHIIPGKLRAARLTRNPDAFLGTMLPGYAARVHAEKDILQLNEAVITQRDLFATNGVIHLLTDLIHVAEASEQNGVTTESANESLKDLVQADPEQLSGLLLGFESGTRADESLMPLIQLPGSRVTLFAPVNQAFTNLIIAQGITAECALDASNAMADVFFNHLIPGTFTSADFARYVEANANIPVEFITLAGHTITIASADSEGMELVGASVVRANAPANNGVLFVVNDVLLPPGM